MSTVLAARGITKRFPGVTALREVSFDLRPGEIHALCGENGAGKSTLIKLLSGLHAHGSYEGELTVAGERAEFRGIADAQRAGLAVIYQELALVEEMTVAENICLGSEPRRGVFIDWEKVHRQATELLRKFGVAIDPATPVARLGVGEKQLVEIVKALGKDSRILILDEPTAALAEHEVQILLGILRDLRQRGLACIYISHKLDEVFALADRITVLRDGATIGTWDAAETSKTEVIRHMVGREIGELFPRRQSAPGAFLRDLIEHPEKALALSTRGTQIILNADALVDVSPEYVRLPREAQRLLHPQLHPLAREARDRAFALLLARPPAPDEVIHFTAGGQASGKSTLIRQLTGTIYDSMLADFDAACRLIESVLARRTRLAIHYVHRPFDQAVAANIARYFDTGRAPNVPRMADRHAAARATFAALLERYERETRVRFWIVVNAPPHEATISPHQLRDEWPAQSVDALIRAGNAGLDEERSAGRIDEAFARHLGGGTRSGFRESGRGSLPGSQGSEPALGGGESEGHPVASAHPGSVGPALRVERLTVADPRTGRVRLHDISFALAPGEVLGIGGLMGAGRTELLTHLFGAWGERRGGRVWLGAEELPPLSPAEILPRGLVLVSEDRRRYGLHLPQPIGFNLSLSSLSRLTRAGLLDSGAEWQANDRQFRALRVKAPGLEAPVGKLSGGNQQKVVLGKALMTAPRVIFLDEPTRGIDVGAKLELYEIINQLTDAGRAVVLVSSELPELMGMSDRILMLHEGRVGGVFVRTEATPERLLAAAMGGK